MYVKQFLTGGDRNFGYIAADESSNSAVIIDPSYSPKVIADFAREKGYNIEYVFNTHSDSDHTNGNDEILRLTGVQAVLFREEEPKTGLTVVDGTSFPLGNLTIQVIHTPGHTNDSICLYIGDAVFTGDTLFVGKVGGTDFGDNARKQYDSLHNKLLTLPEQTRVFPGHNVGISPESTITHERKTNPFLLQPDLASFINLKKNWLEYKKTHGIA